MLEQSKNNLVWIDLEMTGLNPEIDTILEIATIITDQHFNIIAEGPALIVHQPDEVLERMDPWCIKAHGDSGLTQAVKNSNISLEQAKNLTLEFIQQYCTPQSAPLCGNSVWNDKIFLIKYMPQITNYLHYRLIDTTSVKQIVRYSTGIEEPYIKAKTHRALDDIKESIAELQYYKKTYFKF